MQEKISKIRTKKIPVIFTAMLLGVFLIPSLASLDTVGELRKQMEDRNERIQELEKEINKFREEAERTGKEVSSLQNTLNNLNASQRAIEAELEMAENRLRNTQDTLSRLAIEIKEIEEGVEKRKEALAESIRHINNASKSPMIIAFLSQNNISSLWQEIANLKQFQDTLYENIEELRELRESLSAQREEQGKEEVRLSDIRSELGERKQALDYNIEERERILRVTQNQESEYLRLVSEKQDQKVAFEKELFEIESKIQYAIDPSKIPSPQPGLLSWPLDNIYITQLFGKTVSAQRLYASGTHNGVDFRASVGTPIRSVAAGTVKGYGNTDRYPGCYSYGRWILIEHDNGLSSLYAHLSVISAQEGQRVDRGSIIGYSGNTGYSTGPHLHLTIYTSQGVKIQQYTSSINCKQAFIPLADRRAYLDPMQYLPAY